MENLVVDDDKFSIWEFLETDPKLTEDDIKFLDKIKDLNSSVIPLKLFLTACHNDYFSYNDGVAELLKLDGTGTGYKYDPSEIEDMPDGYPSVLWVREQKRNN